MYTVASCTEWQVSQKPALTLLRRLGYTYLSPEQALAARDTAESRVLLEIILKVQLRKINHIEYKGKRYPFSDENICAAIEALREIPDLSVVRSKEQVYDLLTLGKSFEQGVEGDRKSFTLNYIDWENFDNKCSESLTQSPPD